MVMGQPVSKEEVMPVFSFGLLFKSRDCSWVEWLDGWKHGWEKTKTRQPARSLSSAQLTPFPYVSCVAFCLSAGGVRLYKLVHFGVVEQHSRPKQSHTSPFIVLFQSEFNSRQSSGLKSTCAKSKWPISVGQTIALFRKDVGNLWIPFSRQSVRRSTFHESKYRAFVRPNTLWEINTPSWKTSGQETTTGRNSTLLEP